LMHSEPGSQTMIQGLSRHGKKNVRNDLAYQ
jgi:hypothetical protein